MIYALVILLAADPIPRVSWYGSADDCRVHAAVQAFHHQSQGRGIEWSGCQPVDARTLRILHFETYAPRIKQEAPNG